MLRRPFTPIAVLISLYIHLVVRELGHVAAALALDLPTKFIVQYRVLPAWQIDQGMIGIPERSQALFIIAGPAAALTLGYVLLGLIARRDRRPNHPLVLLPAVLCYAMLILDPLYYSIIPLLRLGGEPAAVERLLSAPSWVIVIPAVAFLSINLILAGRVLAPVLRRSQRDAETSD
jgi:hypothetical protein